MLPIIAMLLLTVEQTKDVVVPDPQYEAGMAEIRDIAAHAQEIYDNSAILSRDRAARTEEIAVLNRLYPSIHIPSTADVITSYNMLGAYKTQRFNALKPVFVAHLNRLKATTCANLNDLQQKYDILVASEGYQTLTLTDRLAVRQALEDQLAASKAALGGYKCP